MELIVTLLLDDLTPAVRGEAAQDRPLPCPFPLLLLDTGPAGHVVGHFTALAAFNYDMGRLQVVEVDVGAAVGKGETGVGLLLQPARLGSADQVRSGMHVKVSGQKAKLPPEQPGL